MNRLQRLPVGVLLAGVLLVPADAARANLIQNGDFSLSVPSNGTGNGWTSSGTNVFWDSSAGNPSPSFVLNESGQLATDPRVEQTVSGLTIGLIYRLQGDRLSYAPSFGNPDSLAFAVFLDENLILELPRGGTNTLWESFTVDFIATSTTHTIEFVAERNGDDSSYRIDNISLLVPEPGPAVLLSMATSAALGWALRRRAHSPDPRDEGASG